MELGHFRLFGFVPIEAPALGLRDHMNRAIGVDGMEAGRIEVSITEWYGLTEDLAAYGRRRPAIMLSYQGSWLCWA